MSQLLQKIPLLFLFLCLFTELSAQNVIQFQVMESETNKPLSFTNIMVQSDSSVYVTDSEGIVHISSAKFPSSVRLSYIGFETRFLSIFPATKDTIVYLLRKEIPTGEVLVEDNRIHQNINSLELKPLQMRNMFSIGGERDPIKALANYAAFSQPNELSGGLFVRGGNPDQNIIMLDGIPLLNAFHGLGFLSVIQGDALSSMSVHTGTIPGFSPGRMGSAIILESLTPNKQWKNTFSIGILTSQALSVGPINKKSGLLVSVRRTYADIILKNLYIKSVALPIASFGDMMISGNYQSDDYGRFATTLFYSADQFHFGEVDSSVSTDFVNIKYNYSTVGQSIRHDVNLNPKTNLKTAVYYSVNSSFFDGPKAENSYDVVNFGFNLSLQKNINHDLIAQTGLMYNNFNQPEGSSYYVDTQSFYEELRYWVKLVYSFSEDLSIEQMTKMSMFSKSVDRLFFRDKSSDRTNTPSVFSGYISASYHLMHSLKFESSFSTNYQPEQIYSSQQFQLPTDHWSIPENGNDIAKSTEFCLGFSYQPTDFFILSTKFYNKTISNLITPYLEMPVGYVNFYPEYGNRFSTGIEIDASFDMNKWSTSLSYKYSETKDQFPTINDGDFIYPMSNQPHEFFVQTEFQATENLKLTSNLIYKTGQYYPYLLKVKIPEGENWFLFNKHRYPDYFRIDFSMIYHFSVFSPQKNAEFLLNFYNVTIHRNVNFMVEESNPLPEYQGKIVRNSFAFIPFFPSIGLRIEL